MSIADKIKEKAERKKDELSNKQSKFEKENDQRVAELTPMFNQLKSELAEFGFTVILHNDRAHLPSPAIHIKSNIMPWGTMQYGMISEIYMTPEKTWRAGSCNAHRYALKTDKDLIEHVTEAVSGVLAR